MTEIDTLLRSTIADGPAGFTLALDPGFQGLPEMAHGGTVLAAFDIAAGVTGSRRIAGLYRRRVPLGLPLPLAIVRAGSMVTCRLEDGLGTVLVEGGVEAAAEANGTAPVERADAKGDPLPVSSTCFACGVDNPIGLRARLLVGDDRVHGRWEARPEFRTRRGMLAPVVLTTLLDEAAFWLGALASGESGMTTELAVTLVDGVPFGTPIHVAGERARTRPRADDARYWDTEVTACDGEGRELARGAITFVAVRGAARRLVTGLLALNPPDVLRRAFPLYAR